MKIRPSVNSSITVDRSIEQFATNRDFVVNSQNVVHLLYCFYIGENMIVYNKDVIVNDAVVIEEHTSLRYNLSRGKYHLI